MLVGDQLLRPIHHLFENFVKNLFCLENSSKYIYAEALYLWELKRFVLFRKYL